MPPRRRGAIALRVHRRKKTFSPPAARKARPAKDFSKTRTSGIEIMRSKSAPAPENLLDELQSTLAHGTVARRAETLRRVTELFHDGAVDYPDDQVVRIDDVFQCL